MSVQRVAVIFDDAGRPETTGVYCLRALKDLTDVEHLRPVDLEALPRDKFELYVNVDDGLSYLLPTDLHPAAWWAIDTHMDFAWCLTKSHDFDFVFAAQRDGAEQLRDEGISTTWLPLACDPEVHCKHDVEKAYDLCFIGNIAPSERADLVHVLQGRFPNTFVGKCYFDDMARTYSASRIVFNRSVRNDINMRVFEAAACGSLLLTNDLKANGQDELLRDGVHVATYRDAEELVDKARYYLRHESVRERIAAAGRAEVLARHTYRHRMQSLLETIARQQTARPVVSHAIADAAPIRSKPETTQPGNTAKEPDEVTTNPEDACDLSYFEFVRPEVLALVPASARRVLDIGCGAGRLGEAIKARQGAVVVGIEMNAAAARQAQCRLDQVFIGNAEELELRVADGAFECVICADVLEHLREPEKLLIQVRHWLRPDGTLVASIPNARHHTVVRSLLAGNWTYEPAGLLDQTHLRFFTRRDIIRLFEDAGYTIPRLQAVPGPGDEEWWQGGPRSEVTAGRLHIEGLPPDEAEEFYVYQYLVTAHPVRSEPVPSATKVQHDSTQETLPQPVEKHPKETIVETRPRRRSPRVRRSLAKSARKLRILLLGDFGSSWRHETLTADALAEMGHDVRRFHEYLVPSVGFVARELGRGRYDCLLFYKGRIGARTTEEVFAPTGEAIADVLSQIRVPAYIWYVDRAYRFDMQPSREIWMRRVAPLCRVAFVADAALASTDWARWHILREPVDHRAAQHLYVPDDSRRPVAFIGQLYGDRAQELHAVGQAFPLEFIADKYGSALSPAVQSYKIILGPRYPTVPGFWGNRVYVVLGNGGFFLAPEVEGMRAEGLIPGVHYAVLGPDPVADIRSWLQRTDERVRIARAGQELVLSRFTYAHAVAELCRVIEGTM
jgi:2-polyprenyl-3-methyl-5-hydroxy-6-metoxy-1,4-benzoquinol methylase